MARTRTELIREVLLQLAVLSSDGTPSAADADVVGKKYDDLHGEWEFEELVYWDANAIPPEAFTTVALLVANRVQNGYGRSASIAEMDTEETRLLRRLRRNVAKRATGFPTKAIYF
jgi:hypothetical protein